jgi:hypothetical protein
MSKRDYTFALADYPTTLVAEPDTQNLRENNAEPSQKYHS